MNARAKLAENVSRETLHRLEIFVELLLKWTKKINLISASTKEDIWRRHILDSAQFVDAAPTRFGTWADLGSGAGLPGLVVAAYLHETHPDARVTLIEKDARKAMFLHEASREMSLSVEILHRRLTDEDLEKNALGRYDVISARALAPLNTLLHLAVPLLRPEGICLFAKGRLVETEIDEAASHWRMNLDRIPSVTERGSVLLRIKGLGYD